MPADFEKRDYWHERFRSETSFEWLATSAAFMEVLLPYLQRRSYSARILHVGSGTSDLHNHLRQHGFFNVTNIDYEPLALERGRQLERNRFGDVRMKYLVADATQLEVDEKYHVVVDKSTADAIACGESGALLAMAKAIRRCLDDNGFWVSLSFSPSRFELVQSIFEVELISKIATPKSRLTDPDIFHSCYLLRPKRQL
jgi:SAM-dependent methyltransferase